MREGNKFRPEATEVGSDNAKLGRALRLAGGVAAAALLLGGWREASVAVLAAIGIKEAAEK